MFAERKKKTIFLPLEHSEREFIPKLFLARFLLEKNYRVFFGSSEAIGEISLKQGPGIFFHKSTHPKSPEFRGVGHKFVFLDEEGGITTPRSQIKDFCRWRYATLNKDRQDLALLPNKHFLEAIQILPNGREVKLTVTGWPRVDLWRSEFAGIHASEKSKIVSRFGNFYLFVSSFGATDEAGFDHLIAADSPTEKFKIIHEHKKEAFQEYVGLIQTLSPLLARDEQIVVRPHPSESIEGWTKVLGQLPNVVVTREGDIGPWIQASRGVIHFGSTSVTQTVIAGKPAVSFKIRELEGVTDSPSFELTKVAHSAEEALLELRKQEELPELAAKKTRIFSTLKEFADYDPGKLAVEKIVDALEALETNLTHRRPVPFGTILKIMLVHYGSMVKTAARKLGILKRSGKTVFENLPGGVSPRKVARVLKDLNSALGTNRRYKIVRLAPYAVLIEKA